MSDLEQFNGGGRGSVGDLRHFILGSAAPLLTLQGQQWLKTGVLIPYVSGDHAQLVALFPGLGSVGMPASVALPGSAASKTTIHKLSTHYVYFNRATSSTVSTHSSTDLISWSSSSIGMSSGARASVVLSDRVMVTGPNSPTSPIRTSSAATGAAWADVVGHSNTTYECAASSGALAVFGVITATTQGSNHLATSTDGTSVTQRTGTGGGNFTIFGMTWSPCANAFLFLGASAINKTTNGYTQTACTLPGGVNFAADGYGMQEKVAHSATATLMLMADGRLLRTTDGTTFAIVPFAALNLAGIDPSSAVITHDGTRFIVGMNGGASALPAFAYSDDDGLTWAVSHAFDDYTQAAVNAWNLRGLVHVNSKTLLMAGVGSSGVPSLLYDLTGMVDNAPDNVGTQRQLRRAENQQLSTIAYVRTK